jgi:hypothetical protein
MAKLIRDKHITQEEWERQEYIRDLAKQQHAEDGVCEIDHNALISEGDDNGTYVQAWVWVDFAGTQLDKEQEEQ